MDNKIILRIDSLLENIDKILDDTKDCTIDDFYKSDILLRATCFSLAQIGEQMSKIKEVISDKYFMLPWRTSIGMRNIIIHDYGSIDIEQVFSTIGNDLIELKTAFLAIKNDIENNNLKTVRLTLRKIKKSDAKHIFENYAKDEEVVKFLTWNAHKTVKETKKIVDFWLEEEKDPRAIRYVITLNNFDEPIGMIDVVKFNGDIPEIGYCLSRKMWRQGYMTEACKRLLKYLFDIGFKEVTIEAIEENVGSNKVIEKCGFEYLGKEKRQLSKIKPQIVVVNRYKLLKKDFQKNSQI